jgi:uroporphyrinogen decarboxylase
MNPKENVLEAIRFGQPKYVPRTNEHIWHSIQFLGNFRCESWTDSWGIEWKVGIDGTVPFPKGNPLTDLDHLSFYHTPNPDDLVFTAEMEHELSHIDRDKMLICGDLTYLLFERAWAIMGMENFLMALITHPDEVRILCHAIANYARGVFDRYLELGVDVISFSEDLGSQRALMISPKIFRDIFLPEYQFCFENVLKAGKIINFHSCGCVDAIARDLASIGVAILNPVQARANDLATTKSNTFGKMALQGAIDTALLVTGTPQQVRDEVIRVVEILKPGGGYICGPDQEIPGMSPQNLAVLWQTAIDVGKY